MILKKPDVFEFDPGNEDHQKIEEVDELLELEILEPTEPGDTSPI